MSSLDLLLKLPPEGTNAAGCAKDVVFELSEMGVVGTGTDVSSSLEVALPADLSRSEMREAMSAMIVFLGRRIRGPGGG